MVAGYEYGLNLSVVRSSVTSRKLTIFFVIHFYGDLQVVIGGIILHIFSSLFLSSGVCD